jgi:hypothetical protein
VSCGEQSPRSAVDLYTGLRLLQISAWTKISVQSTSHEVQSPALNVIPSWSSSLTSSSTCPAYLAYLSQTETSSPRTSERSLLSFSFPILDSLDLEYYSRNVRHSRLIPLSEHALWTNYSCSPEEDEPNFPRLLYYLLLLAHCTWSLLHNDDQGLRVAVWDAF